MSVTYMVRVRTSGSRAKSLLGKRAVADSIHCFFCEEARRAFFSGVSLGQAWNKVRIVKLMQEGRK